MQDTLLQSQQIWKWKAEGDIRKGKKTVQSRDHANIKLVLVESFNNIQDLCHYLIALFMEHHVVKHVV